MSKYFWMPSSDSTIIYVKEIRAGWLRKGKIRTIAHLYSSGEGYGWDYDGAIKTAEQLIKRLDTGSVRAKPSPTKPTKRK